MKTVRAQVIAWHSGDGVVTDSTSEHVSQVVLQPVRLCDKQTNRILPYLKFNRKT